MRKTRKSGFTVVELLVVIAIIALLLAMLVPYINQTKNHAKFAVCQSNLGQWGTLFIDLAADNDGYFTEGILTDGTRIGWVRGEWLNVLRTQWITRPGILKCPNAILPRYKNDDPTSIPLNYGGSRETYRMPGFRKFKEVRSSYGMNCWVYNPPKELNGKKITKVQGRPVRNNWRSINSTRTPARVPMFLDSMWRGGGPMYEQKKRYLPAQVEGQWNSYAYEMQHFCINRHNYTVNAVFIDAHVRRIKLKALWKLRWHKTWNVKRPRDFDWPDWMKRLPEVNDVTD